MFTITGLLVVSMSECFMDQCSLHNAQFLEVFFLFLPPILKVLVLWVLGLINCCVDSTLCLPSLCLSIPVNVSGCISWQHASLAPYSCRSIHLCPWISMLVYFWMRFTGAGVSVLFRRSGFFLKRSFVASPMVFLLTLPWWEGYVFAGVPAPIYLGQQPLTLPFVFLCGRRELKAKVIYQ